MDQSVIHAENESVSEHGYDDNDGVHCGFSFFSLEIRARLHACSLTIAHLFCRHPLSYNSRIRCLSMSGVAGRSTHVGCAIAMAVSPRTRSTFPQRRERETGVNWGGAIMQNARLSVFVNKTNKQTMAGAVWGRGSEWRGEGYSFSPD